ncbi:MAG: hypothetical protein ACRDKH_03565 [Solirubrobacterales bacterium]
MRVTTEACTWCGAEVEADDGFRAFEPAGDRRAVFCRLEHIIPWAIQDAHWDAGTVDEPSGGVGSVERCSQCDAALTDTLVLLVRHRGEHRVADGFCSVDHMEEWAKAGGRWR